MIGLLKRAAVLAVLVLAACGASEPREVQQVTPSRPAAAAALPDFSALVEKAGPAVVSTRA